MGFKIAWVFDDSELNAIIIKANAKFAQILADWDFGFKMSFQYRKLF